jgi:EAL and modified HD-GYP domain-containing signal transduction protein
MLNDMTLPAPQPDGPPVEQYFLGRQPILDGKLNLYGFELLFRSARQNSAQGADAVTATANVINTILHNPHMLGSYRGYVKADQTLFMSDMLQLLPPGRIGIEILQSIDVDENVLARCRELRALGFDLVLNENSAHDERWEPLLEFVSQVRINASDATTESTPRLLRHLRRWPVKILAKKVESQDDVVRCRELGVDLYQGYFFARPRVVSGKRLTHSELALLKLSALIEADSDSTVIETALKEEPSLTMDLLRLTNSASSPVQHRITSIGHAITVLGRQRLQRWLQLLLFARLSPGFSFPSPLLQLAATRARFMEIAVETLVPRDKALAGRAFLTGVISLMSVLLSQPVHVIVENLDLAPDVWDAVLHHKGILGALLEITERWEHGDYPHCIETCLKVPGLDMNIVNDAHIEALTWSNNLGSTTP